VAQQCQRLLGGQGEQTHGDLRPAEHDEQECRFDGKDADVARTVFEHRTAGFADAGLGGELRREPDRGRRHGGDAVSFDVLGQHQAVVGGHEQPAHLVDLLPDLAQRFERPVRVERGRLDRGGG
jgi:hypothetical protein